MVTWDPGSCETGLDDAKQSWKGMEDVRADWTMNSSVEREGNLSYTIEVDL